MAGGSYFNELSSEDEDEDGSEDEHRDFSHTEFNNGQTSNMLGLIHPQDTMHKTLSTEPEYVT